MSVAIIAALPRELARLTAGLKPDTALRNRGIFLFRRDNAVLVAAGMGRDRAALAVEAAQYAVPVETLISVGLAGSCSEDVRPGSVLHASLVIDSHTGERFESTDSSGAVVLVSTEQIASTSEKRRLQQSYGASMVDMEAATVGRLARAHGLAFRAIKGISDAHDFDIAHLARFADQHGHFRTLRFATHTTLRPHTWGDAATLGRHSKAALKRLTETLLALIAP